MSEERAIFSTVAGALAALLAFATVRDDSGIGGPMIHWYFIVAAVFVGIAVVVVAWGFILTRRPMSETDEYCAKVDQDLTARGL